MERRLALSLVAAVACSGSVSPLSEAHEDITVSAAVDVSQDTASENETPLAVNPVNEKNLITGANDWNYNDGCALNYSFNGGKTWSPTLPNGFLPGVTRYTNDPAVPGTGFYDAGGDPQIAFGPDGTAYYVCQAFNFTPPYEISLLISRSYDGGKTWLDGAAQKLVKVNAWQGNGKEKGSNGQFADHESIHVDTHPGSPHYGSVYVTWVQFDGNSAHSPVYVSYSRDGAKSFTAPIKATSGSIRNNQDARMVSAPDGTLYLTFDNGLQGNKGLAFFVTRSTDGGDTWSNPVQLALVANAVCTFPPYCFNISGLPFRSGGTYAAPAYDPVRNRLVVIWPDIIGPYAQVYLSWAPASDLSRWSMPVAIAPAAGDRFQNEFTIAPNGRYDVSFYDRSYTGNAKVDITYAQSLDGGASWHSRRVTTASFDPGQWGVPSSNVQGFRPFIGDYNGQYSTNSSVGIAWTGVSPPAPLNLDIDFAAITP
jgi:hypothetical protein